MSDLKTVSWNLKTCTLLLGWVIGCLPTSSPFPNSPKFKIQKCGFPFLYSIVVTLIILVVSMDNVLTNFNLFLAGFKLSDKLLAIGSAVFYHNWEIVIRVTLLGTSAFVVKMIHLCEGIVPANCMINIFTISTFVYKTCSLVYYHFRNTVWKNGMQSLIFSNGGLLHHTMHFFTELTTVFVGIYTVNMVLLIGFGLQIILKDFYLQFESNFLIPSSSIRSSKLELFDKSFRGIKKGFRLFNLICGSYCFLLILESTFYLLFGLFNLAASSDSMNSVINILALCRSFITIFVICHLGESMEREISKQKHKLNSIILKHDMEYSGNSAKKMMGLMKDFDWKFTANNFFTINYTFLLKLSGCMMTIYIFMFQLKMTEESSNSKF